MKPQHSFWTRRTRTFGLSTLILFSATLPQMTAWGADDADAGVADMTETELATLDRFLSLSDAELDQIEQAIRRIRRMSPAEREAFRSTILSYRRLPDAERVAIRQSWGQSSAEEQERWRQLMHSLPVDERDALRAEMQSLAPGERADFRRKKMQDWQARQEAGEVDVDVVE